MRRKPIEIENLNGFRVIRVFALAALITVVFSYLDLFTHAFDYFEQELYGDRLEVCDMVHPGVVQKAVDLIKVVTVDDDSFSWASSAGSSVRFFPRSDYARLIDILSSDQAKVIGFDMLFDSHDPGDRSLARSIKRAGNVLLACGDAGDNNIRVTYPEPLLIASGCRLGHSRVPLSIDRPAVDQIQPTVRVPGGWMPAFSVEAVRMYRGIDKYPVRNSPSPPAIPELPMVMNSGEAVPMFKIRYLYKSAGDFEQIPIQAVLDAQGASKSLYENLLKNKIVLIGDVTKIDHDRNLTPLGTMTGVMIQANAIATVLSGRYIREASNLEEFFLLAFVVGFTTVISTIWTLRRVAFIIVLMLPGLFFINVWLFVGVNYYVHLAGPAFAILLTVLTVLLERGLAEESEKARIRSLLLRYVNPRIADHILRNPELIGGRGKRQIGTVLFSDVRGFTQLSEELSPEDLVARMNDYFQTITEIVFRHDGTAASIVGDAMMAVFGIPVATDDHADQAIAAAIEIQAAGKELRKKWSEDANQILESGIGINTGEVIVGEVGGRHLRNFTVYGLQVNIASRVENLNRDYHTKILITRATYESLKRPITVGEPKSVTLKGVGEPVEIFELLGEEMDDSPPPGPQF